LKGGVNMPQITLRAARVNVGLSRAAVAEKLDISIGTVKNWENGTTFPTQPKIEQLCEIYGVVYDDIFFN
jgi:transcriptional regulator with XRE-family HTH domain